MGPSACHLGARQALLGGSGRLLRGLSEWFCGSRVNVELTWLRYDAL
jgi:hypothetical protein